jgi:hypothetical protein
VSDVDPGTVAFVGAFVAGLFALAAGLAYATAPTLPPVRGIALVLAGGGALSLAAGLGAAVVLRLLQGRDR